MNNMQKGKIAEQIVKDMFKEAGFKVINYGYEHTVPELAKSDTKVQGLAGMYIRHQPDFIVINKNNEAFFVEVKHRSKYIVPEKEIFPYPNCYVLLLTKGAILAQSTSNLFSQKMNFKFVNQMPPFKEIPFSIIKKTILKIRRKLGDDTLTEQLIGSLVEKTTNRKFPFKPADSIRIIRDKSKNNINTIKRRLQRKKAKKRNKGNVYAQKKRWKSRRRWK